MHPFLTHPRWLLGYLAVWGMLATIPTALVALPEAAAWAPAAMLTLPATLAFALFTLSTWYVCRALPPRASALPRLVIAHAVAATIWGVLWIALIDGGALLLGALVPAWSELPARLSSRRGALLAVGGLFYLLVAAFHYLLLALEGARRAAEREGALAAAAREAQLRALEAQVHPHFLFNSLNAVSGLVSRDAARAREMCVLLADFLRQSLASGERPRVSLAEELSLAESYLGVERIRLGERLRVIQRVDEASRGCLLPPLLLQPLVENAVRHGVATLAHGGELELSARCERDRLRLRVTNPFDPAAPPRRRGGRGLANVRRRLVVRYGKEASLEVRREPDRFTVILSLPCERE